MAKYTSFEDMQVYQKAMEFIVNIYRLTIDNIDLTKDFAIRDQLRRASLSITNNIAEGFERESKKEFIRFLYISKGSAGECRNILNVIQLLGYINQNDYQKYRQDIVEISKQLGNYIKYLKKLEQLK